MPPRYSDAEVEEILKRALSRERKEGISHDDLVAAASEAGIDRGDIEAAATELARERELMARQAEIKLELRRHFWNLAGNFAALNLLIVAIDALTGPEVWFYWVTLGTGFALAQRGLRTFAPRESDLRRAERRLARRERRRRRYEAKYARAHAREHARGKKRAEAEFERVVEQGAEALLRSAADRIERFNRERDAQRVRVDPEAARDGRQLHLDEGRTEGEEPLERDPRRR